ncbi:MAG: hypothetical protein AAGE52_17475 [Myxococcota bacterium]
MSATQLLMSGVAVSLVVLIGITMLRLRRLGSKQEESLKLLRQSVKATKRNNELLTETNSLLAKVLAKAAKADD